MYLMHKMFIVSPLEGDLSVKYGDFSLSRLQDERKSFRINYLPTCNLTRLFDSFHIFSLRNIMN
jgi:hypothetical protein